MKYQYVIVQKEVKEVKRGKDELISSVKVFLGIKDIETGIVLPHPLSNFIKSEFDSISLSLNTQISYGEEIKRFLNFILECIEDEDELFLPLEEDGVSGLTLQHGSSYISFLTQRVKSGEIEADGVYRAERILIKFYKWLSDQNILKEKVEISQEVRNKQGETVTIPISPFKNFELGTEYPNRRDSKQQIKDRKLHDFGSGRLDLVNLFLRVAELEAPDIAVGIAFQFYGGLRRGEVINLLRNSVKEPKKNSSGVFTLNIEDNWKILFPNKALTVSEQVKKVRIQPVFHSTIVNELYEKHIKNLSRLEKRGKIKNRNALFISNHTGKPISGMAYWERFTKVKNKFLEIVLEHDLEDYNYLISKPWSTHIGRGIYTNMITFLLKWSPSELAIARGDSSIESAQRYIEEQNVILLTEKATEIIAKATQKAELRKNISIQDLRSI